MAITGDTESRSRALISQHRLGQQPITTSDHFSRHLTFPRLRLPTISPDSLSQLQAVNATTLESLDTALASANETEGESEISDALRARANYLTKIGDKDRAVEAQKLAMEKTYHDNKLAVF